MLVRTMLAPSLLAASALGAVAQEDPPSLSRHAGSVLENKAVEEYGEYTLVTVSRRPRRGSQLE